MKSNTNYIGTILKKCRIEKGLTQEQVSELTNVAPRYLSQLERGLSTGSLQTLIKFCNFFEITPNLLLGGLLQNSITSHYEDISDSYTNLTTDNKEIVDNLILYLSKKQKSA